MQYIHMYTQMYYMTVYICCVHCMFCNVCCIYLYVHNMCTPTSYCVVYVHICMYTCILSRTIMWCMYICVLSRPIVWCMYICVLSRPIVWCMYICVLSCPIVWCILPLTLQDKSDSEMERIKSTVLLCYGYVTYHSPPQLVWGQGGCEGGGVGCVVVRVEGVSGNY